jgi:hypothetical protein
MLRVIFRNVFSIFILAAFLVGNGILAEEKAPASLQGEIKDNLEGTTKTNVDKVLEEARIKAASMSSADVAAKAEEKSAMQIPKNIHAEDGQQAARQAADQYSAPQTQKRLQCEQSRIQQQVFGAKTEEATDKSGTLSASETIYLFLSSSMPEEVVHTYLMKVASTGDQRIHPVMYGLVQGLGNKAITAEYFNRVLREDLECRDKQGDICKRIQAPIQVNSLLFKQYSVTQVPTVVYASGENFWSVQGDTALDYLLEQINREAHSPALSS